MKTLSKIQSIRRGFILSLLAGVFCCSAHAGLYSFNFSDSGVVPQGGMVFSAEEAVSSISLPSPYITSIELILTFNDAASLAGNSSGIQGSLNLGTGTGSPFVSFYPSETGAGTGGQVTYDMTFSGFDGLNPNATWGLVLWDNGSSGIENNLEGWTLNITAVPEPVTIALPIFGGLMLAIGLVRRFISRKNESAA